jgi:hypothetical protein
MNTDHIIHNSTSQRMECQHCGFTEAIKMPATIDAIVGKMDAFTKAHEGCKRPQSEAVMSEYIKGFDAGYGYVLNEIERFSDEYKGNRFALAELLHHLKMEDRPDVAPSDKP